MQDLHFWMSDFGQRHAQYTTTCKRVIESSKASPEHKSYTMCSTEGPDTLKITVIKNNNKNSDNTDIFI